MKYVFPGKTLLDQFLCTKSFIFSDILLPPPPPPHKKIRGGAKFIFLIKKKKKKFEGCGGGRQLKF